MKNKYDKQNFRKRIDKVNDLKYIVQVCLTIGKFKSNYHFSAFEGDLLKKESK